jgi:hypothetical protein
MLDLEFSETSQNFSSFTYTTFFFIVSKGVPKEKNLKNQCIVLAIFQHFYFGSPLETMKKKVVQKS